MTIPSPSDRTSRLKSSPSPIVIVPANDAVPTTVRGGTPANEVCSSLSIVPNVCRRPSGWRSRQPVRDSMSPNQHDTACIGTTHKPISDALGPRFPLSAYRFDRNPFALLTPFRLAVVARVSGASIARFSYDGRCLCWVHGTRLECLIVLSVRQ